MGATAQIGSQGTPATNVDTLLNFVGLAGQDPNGWWNSSTHYFTPTIAGYYLVTLQTTMGTSSTNGQFNTQIRKNNNNISLAIAPLLTSSAGTATATVTVYLNGTTDYNNATVYINQSSGIQQGTATQITCVLIA